MKSIAVIVLGLAVLAGCEGGSDPIASENTRTTTTVIAVDAEPTIDVPVPDFSEPGSDAADGAWSSEVIDFSDVKAEVLTPAKPGSHPAVVLVHGGGFTGGKPEVMHDLAAYLADNGFIAVNTGYRLATTEVGSFPEAIDDVACAVRLAAVHEASNGEVTVLGVSAGAHIAILVALVGDQYGEQCPESEPIRPQQLVSLGLPGVADSSAQLAFFLGGSQEDAPEAWALGDPMGHIDQHPSLRALFLHAESDSTVSPEAAERAFQGINDAGAVADYGVVPRIGHFNLADPRAVGDVVVEWLGS